MRGTIRHPPLQRLVFVILGALFLEREPEHFMAWFWLKSLWRRKNPVPADVVMYTRHGCHLCEQAWEQLQRARQRYGFALRQVDIDGDAQLIRAYGECVPVVTIDGRVRFRGVVNPVLLERLLRATTKETR